jgi:hypothetical protein
LAWKNVAKMANLLLHVLKIGPPKPTKKPTPSIWPIATSIPSYKMAGIRCAPAQMPDSVCAVANLV